MSNGTVYTGVWQNYSQGGWKGSTLTLERLSASLLISSLATFITLVGTRFWAIVSFFIHQIRASTTKKDGIHHQHQVIYRNSSSPLGTAWTLLKVSWAWRNRARYNVPRFAVAALPPILVFAGFAAASVLSAKVAAPPGSASQVKLISKNCGFIDWSTKSDAIGTVSQDGGQIFGPYWINNAIRARSYARSCYDDKNTQNLASCHLYVSSRLPYATNDQASCPFKGHRCVLGDDGAYQMQTPWLNSHENFGINAPSEDRIEWRKTTCSVLNVTDRIRTRAGDSSTVYTWHLGYVGLLQARINETFQYNENTRNLGIGYTIRPDFAVDQDRYPGWTPIDDLLHTDADVSILYFSQNSVLYPDPIDDPMFPHTDIFATCQQIRNPATGISTPPLGFQRLSVQSMNIGLNPAQIAAAFRLIVPSEQALMFNSVNGLGAMALKAQDFLYVTIGSGLPSNQWQIELRGWFETALAALQASIIDFASKEIAEISAIGDLSMTNDTTYVQPMCDDQMILAIGDYQSFSMMGIELIVAIGVFIVLLSFVVEHVVAFVQKRWGGQAYKQVLWKTDGVLQQQRLAFECDKVEDWEKKGNSVPVTRLGMAWKTDPLTRIAR